jgi:hypothetical protein
MNQKGECIFIENRIIRCVGKKNCIVVTVRCRSDSDSIENQSLEVKIYVEVFSLSTLLLVDLLGKGSLGCFIAAEVAY